VSKNFAQQFKERLLARKMSEGSCRLPLPLQADFVFLYKLATSQAKLPEEGVHGAEILGKVKEAVKGYMTMKNQQ